MEYRVLRESEDLIEVVASQIIEKVQEKDRNLDLSKVLVVFPNKRACYYLRKTLSKKIKKPYIPPSTFSMDEFIDYCYSYELKKVDTKIDVLSCCKILKDLIFSKSGNEDIYKLSSELNSMNLNSFIFFGLDLFSALEELKIAGITYDKLKSFDVVLDGGSELDVLISHKIHKLSKMYKDFYDELENRGFSTRALRYHRVAEGNIELKDYDYIIFAGFFALNGSEKRIIKNFRTKNDSRVLMIYHDETAKQFIETGKYYPMSYPIDRIEIFECPDTHSQIFKLAEILNKDYESKEEEKTFAIISPSPDTIIPLMNIIDKSLNISIGYPLIKTPLFTFIKSLFDLLDSMKDGQVSVSQYLDFVLHPYTKNIKFGISAEDTRIAFHKIEKELRSNRFRKYINLRNFIKTLNLSDNIKMHLETIHKNTIDRFMEIRDIKDLATKLKGLIEYLYENSTARNHILFFPFCEYMLKALKELENSLISSESLDSPRSYFNLFRKFISFQYVPFTDSSLEDIQVIGFLEARNLKFDYVYILDVNEGIIPDTDMEDSILPYEVRLKLELPTYKDKDLLYDYYFRRLVGSAKLSRIFYVENPRKQRSRFIEQIIWEKQKESSNLSDNCIVPVGYSFSLKPNKPSSVKKDQDIKEYLMNMVYSASSLNTYFQCPLMFYYRYVLLPQVESMNKDIEDKDVGILVHEILKSYFSKVNSINFDKSTLEETINKILTDKFGDITKGEAFILAHQLKEGLSYFIKNYRIIVGVDDIEEISILELEKSFETTIKLNKCGVIKLEGMIDRLEKRGNEVVIIDYKTTLDTSSYKVKWDKFDIDDRSTWADAFKDIQMIFYFYLLSNAKSCDQRPTNASILFLRHKNLKSVEIKLFDDKFSCNEQNKYNWTKSIIETLLEELITIDEFKPTDNIKICERCNYKHICF